MICVRKACIYLASFTWITSLALYTLLNAGNPQWNKYIYLYQQRKLSGEGSEELSPPSDYSGIWQTWHQDGALYSSTEYYRGEKHGLSRMWYPTGERLSIHSYKNNVLAGCVSTWKRDGRPVICAKFENNIPSATFCRWDWESNICTIVYLENAKPVGVATIDSNKLPVSVWPDISYDALLHTLNTFKDRQTSRVSHPTGKD